MSGLVLALGWFVFALGCAGLLYTVAAGLFLQRFFLTGGQSGESANPGGVTILKPLFGAEPGLREHLQGFLTLRGSAPIQVVFGAHSANDPALVIARAVAAEHPGRDVAMVADDALHGQNRKISNVINMMSVAKHDLIVLSDSDIGVSSDYLQRVRQAMAPSNAGVVTCPYYGEPKAGFWSGIAAMGLSYQFLPNVITGVSLGMANPCMGSTIALRRETLDKIGGFRAFRDVLADDYAIGSAVRDLGLETVVAPILLSHGCTEIDFREVWAHELRWAKTVKGVDPAGHVGSIVTHPLPLALLATFLLGGAPVVLALVAVSFLARVWLMRTVDQTIGRPLGSWWLIPMRDIVTLLVFIASFFVSSVEWRGAKFHVTDDGDLKAPL